MDERQLSPGGPQPARPDDLNARIGVLTRREVEARILKPVIEALAAEFGREKVLAILSETIVRLAQTQGEELSRQAGGDGAAQFNDSLKHWTRDSALEIELLEQNDRRLSFNVTRCRYAELYRDLGIPELGALLSCNRDFALIDGFNPRASLSRTQTIMQGAPFCDFRYTFPGDETTNGTP